MYDFSKAELLSNNRNDGGAQSSRRFIVALIAAFLLNLAAAGWAVAQDEVVYHQAGSVMNYDSITGVNGVKAYLIFWQPPNYNFTAAGGPADDVYINTISTFFADLSAQDISLADLSARGFNVKDGYFQITQQYTGPCNGDPILLPEGACSPGPLIYDPLNDQFVDPAPFPPSFPGTPLQESDIQNRIIANINAHNWTAGPTAVFFVFLPYGVEECQQPVMGKVSCSGDGFCAYHNSFSFGQNGNVIYAVMPQVRSIGEGCSIDRSTLPENGYAPVEFSNHYAAPSATPNQLDADWEIFALSHELFESMTDPLLNAWYQPPPPNCTGDNCSDEIGDICNSMAGGFSPGHGGNLLLTSINSRANVVFDEFLVPEVWSNGAQSCVLGSSVRLTIHTGPVRGATSPLGGPPNPITGSCGGSVILATIRDRSGQHGETVTLKGPDDPGWDDNGYTYTPGGGKVREFYYPADFGLGQISLFLGQNPCPLSHTEDNWNIYGIDIETFTASGKPICGVDYIGYPQDPFFRLTGSQPELKLTIPGIPGC